MDLTGEPFKKCGNSFQICHLLRNQSEAFDTFGVFKDFMNIRLARRVDLNILEGLEDFICLERSVGILARSWRVIIFLFNKFPEVKSFDGNLFEDLVVGLRESEVSREELA